MAKKVNGRKSYAKTSPSLIDHIRVAGFGKGSFNETFVKLRIDDGERKRSALLRTDNLHGQHVSDQITRLNQKGAHLLSSKAKAQLIDLLQKTRPSGELFHVATRPGLSNNSFVLPHMVISAPRQRAEKYLYDLPADVLSKFRCQGTLEGWKKISENAAGNSRLILGIGVALSGVVAAIGGYEAPAIQFTGAPGSGKTQLGAIISSVWGRKLDASADRLGAAEIWLHTLNNLDPLLTAHNHTGLVLDETRNTGADKLAQQVLDAVMRSDGGISKGRLNQLEPRRTWLTPVISTSNLSVVELLHATKHRLDDEAYLDRLIDVPLPETGFGIFENLHGHATAGALGQHLKQIAASHFGVVGLEFAFELVTLVRHARKELLDWIEERRHAYIKRAGEDIASPGRDMTRVHNRLATVHASDCLAAELGLLDLSHEQIGEAILKCERDHVRYVAQKVAELSSKPPLELLKDFVRANEDRFIDLRQKLPKAKPAATVPGYHSRKKGVDYVLLTASDMTMAVGGTAAANQVKQDLQASGDIFVTAAGHGQIRFAAKWPIREKKGVPFRRPMIAIRASALLEAI